MSTRQELSRGGGSHWGWSGTAGRLGPGLGSDCSLFPETSWTLAPRPTRPGSPCLPLEASHLFPGHSVEGQMLNHENKTQCPTP